MSSCGMELLKIEERGERREYMEKESRLLISVGQCYQSPLSAAREDRILYA